ncbi:MAG TPA: 5'/3'-nucleotidase SurE, partial [Solirubrobacteraceae bacterium]|nr:5'/3'-nucleotidase SurE [Solirubrobacteraceae bacterium]
MCRSRLRRPSGADRRSRAGQYPGCVLEILLTNDDGIEADGLQTLRRELVALDDVRVVVIAPDGNRSAMARSI